MPIRFNWAWNYLSLPRMKKGRTILDKDQLDITLNRLCHQLIENYDEFEDTCLIGIQQSGVILARRLHNMLTERLGIKPFPFGKLDITFFRDDFRRRDTPLKASPTELDFLVEDKHVVLVDDVLYTGRTIQAAMSALQQFGRAGKIEMLTLVDRRFNRHLPIKADYIGVVVDALDEAYVKVEWEETDQQDRVLLFSPKR
jgi:pyrimidine operon attenuation protein / uracil phosphoribosyltransferase